MITINSVVLLIGFAFCVICAIVIARAISVDGRVHWSAAIVAVFVPLCAFVIYVFVSGPRVEPTERVQTGLMLGVSEPASGTNNEKVASVETLLAGLEERLEGNPEDGKGWLLLARSYQHLGDFSRARLAYEKAEQVGVVDAGLAKILASSEAAIAPGADAAALLLRGEISVSAAAEVLIGSDAAIFVVARARDGRQMPIAAARFAPNFPIRFELSDSNLMIPGTGLSASESLLISASVSPDGNALSHHEQVISTRIESLPINNALLQLQIDKKE